MSTTNRITRSASKARSDDSLVAPSLAPPRSTRGRGSRRGASPAVTPDAPGKDKPEVAAASNRAYGTVGKPADLQLQSAQLGLQQAVNPILQAVSGAEASGNQFTTPKSNLPVVNEEAESSVAGSRASSHNSPPATANSTHGPGWDSQQHWGPHPPPADLQEHPNQQVNGRHRLPSGVTWVVIFDKATFFLMYLTMFVMFSALFSFIWFGVKNRASGVKLDTDGTTLMDNGDTTLSYLDKNLPWILNRINRVEQRASELTFKTVSPNSIPQHQINWFTPGFGAMIDVELSSPTATVCDPTWKPWPFPWMQRCPEIPLSPPQMMALQSWDDPVWDRWCAPRSGGKLQLTIELERKIMPTELIVEYLAKDESPTGYMKSAPKEVELWIQIPDEETRAKISDAVGQHYPFFWQDSSPQGKELHLARELDEDFVPIGRWIYNIYRNTDAQSFPISDLLQRHGVESSKFAIRVNSNWGDADYTCINRLRMHGIDTSGLREYLEEDPSLTNKQGKYGS